jgi:hypothetical protein
MDKKFLRLVLSFFLLVGLLAAGVAIWQLKVVRHGGFEFRVHYGRYETIVSVVDSMLREAENMALFYAPDLKEPQNIQRRNVQTANIERGKGAGWIWASRQKDRLVVWIETLDLGHGGEYGYVYASDGMPPIWDHDMHGERWEITERLDEGWWKIKYDLD